ncbi:MAG: deoxyribodipyrimidine photo-lyase, partial [Methylophilaceae bacterium]|nr:deoxyribodipyrimidine photo-lyase [Methylophilaceae bacterium]
MQKYNKSLVWFRRDLRDYDHAALYHALKNSKQVFCLFIFDTEILNQLQDKADRRVEFIWESLKELKAAFQNHGGDLIVEYGIAKEIVVKQAQALGI